MAEPIIIGDKVKEEQQSTKIRKRKRASSAATAPTLTSDEKASWIHALKQETDKLFDYYREVIAEKVNLNVNECNTVNSMVGVLLEESDLSLSKLVDRVYEKLKSNHERLKEKESGPLTSALVKSAVLFVGQRVMYGFHNMDADVLEDDTASSLWCWETRDLKLLPKSVRGLLKIRRVCRKKVHERITAVLAMIQMLQKPEDDPSYMLDLGKSYDKLCKVLNEADIRSLVNIMLQKNSTEMAAKVVKREEKLLMKQLEKRKLEVEIEKNKSELELQKEKQQKEKRQKKLQEAVEKDERRLLKEEADKQRELKKQQEEAEKEQRRREKEEADKQRQLKKQQEEAVKEQRRREKEEADKQRQLKKQQEEAEKEQRRREKEETELKKQRSIKKQASLMHLFLKKAKTNQPTQNDDNSTTLVSSSKELEVVPEAVTSSMDKALSSINNFLISDIRESHLLSWKQLGLATHSKRMQHWNARQKPKAEMFRKPKLGPTKELAYGESSPAKLVSEWKGQNFDDGSLLTNFSSSHTVAKTHTRKQLLQFDKSYRPAFYGLWPKKSNVVGPRCPFKKDPNLDYDVDSDEEWEEEEPGESLSDCDKDDDEEESLGNECSKADEDEESENGFFVPDGYLSENEGVEVDKIQTDNVVEEAKCSPGNMQDPEVEEFYALLQHQKHLNYLTEIALKKNQPLIIVNLMHENSVLHATEEPRVNSKHERMCFEALSMRPFPGAAPIETSEMECQDKGQCLSNNKSITTPVSPVTAIQDCDIPVVVSTIRSCSQSINKVVESLQQKFPTVPKSQLRSKVREISDYVDNHWQVKKEVLNEVGMPISPDKKVKRAQSISSFFSKRCLPPAGSGLSPDKTSLQ